MNDTLWNTAHTRIHISCFVRWLLLHYCIYIFSACVQGCNTAEVDHTCNIECIELECLIEGGQSPWWGYSPPPLKLKAFWPFWYKRGQKWMIFCFRWAYTCIMHVCCLIGLPPGIIWRRCCRHYLCWWTLLVEVASSVSRMWHCYAWLLVSVTAFSTLAFLFGLSNSQNYSTK